MEPLEDRRMLATFTVTNLSDGAVNFPGNAPGTLRQAIYDANNTPGGDIIQFAGGLSGSINLSIAGDNSFGPTALLVTSAITIQGNTNGITISRNLAVGEMRLFRVTAAGNLTLKDISLTAGLARGANGSAPGESGGEGLGGAVLNQGILNVTASTLYNNQAIGGNGASGGAGGSARGGAIYTDGGTVMLANATLSGNSTSSGAGSSVPSNFGGAIYVRNATLDVHNSTVTNSSAVSARSLYALADNGTVNIDIRSSILAQSVTAGFDVNISADNNGQVNVTGSGNLIRHQNDFEFITVSTDDPQLGPLDFNGGPTMTHALNAESPAVNAGNNSQGLVTDQRGAAYARVVGGAADIGAFEMQTSTSFNLSGDYNRDNNVDAADYVLWRKTFGGEVVPYTGADGDGSGSIQAGDYGVWRTHFGEVAAAAGMASTVNVPLEDSFQGSTLLDQAKSVAFGKLAEAMPNPQNAVSIPVTSRKKEVDWFGSSSFGADVHGAALLNILDRSGIGSDITTRASNDEANLGLDSINNSAATWQSADQAESVLRRTFAGFQG
jgi:hypothetical protein